MNILYLGPPVQFSLVPSGGYYDPVKPVYIIVESSSLVFNCSFQADPEPSVAWIHNGIQVVTSTRHASTGYFSNTPPIGRAEHLLTVRDVVSEDSGNYSCNGTNSYGSHQVTETVKVIGQYRTLDPI